MPPTHAPGTPTYHPRHLAPLTTSTSFHRVTWPSTTRAVFNACEKVHTHTPAPVTPTPVTHVQHQTTEAKPKPDPVRSPKRTTRKPANLYTSSFILFPHAESPCDCRTSPENQQQAKHGLPRAQLLAPRSSACSVAYTCRAQPVDGTPSSAPLHPGPTWYSTKKHSASACTVAHSYTTHTASSSDGGCRAGSTGGTGCHHSQ